MESTTNHTNDTNEERLEAEGCRPELVHLADRRSMITGALAALDQAATVHGKSPADLLCEDALRRIHLIEVLEPEFNAEMRALLEWLGVNPLLRMALEEARECGRYLITVHRKLKDSPPDDLASRDVRKDFPIDAVVDVMQGHCRAILADEARHRAFHEARAADRGQWK